MERFSKTVDLTLRDVGWFPSRNLGDQVGEWASELRSDGFEIFPEAERVLAEFGRLEVDQDAPGVNCAREPFRLVPTLAVGEADRFGEFAEYLKTPLYPLGEACGGHGFLAMGKSGQVFLLMDDIRLLGQNIEDALEKLILGIKSEELPWPGTSVSGEDSSGP
jgi:hypothetical protein